MKQFLSIALLFLCIYGYAIDDIIVTNNKQIPCTIQRITDDSVLYHNSDMVLLSIPISEIKIIQYSDGSKKTFAKTETQKSETIYITPEPQQPETIYIAQEPQKNETIYISSEKQKEPVVQSHYSDVNSSDKKRLAIVESYAGVFVFNDNTPVAEYEIIGEVGCSSRGSVSSNVAINPLTGGVGIVTSVSSSAQYPSIRNQLVTNAILANRDVEGVIIKTPREGEGTALMIKFKNKDTNNALAKVNVHRGLLVFSDCKPYSDYDGVKSVKANSIIWENTYGYIRDNILKKAVKKKGINGIIIYLVDGGRDYAETIYIQ